MLQYSSTVLSTSMPIAMLSQLIIHVTCDMHVSQYMHVKSPHTLFKGSAAAPLQFIAF